VHDLLSSREGVCIGLFSRLRDVILGRQRLRLSNHCLCIWLCWLFSRWLRFNWSFDSLFSSGNSLLDSRFDRSVLLDI